MLDRLARTLAVVDEGDDITDAPLRIEPPHLVLDGGEDVRPLVDIDARERLVVLRSRDHHIVVPYRRLAIVRVLAVRGGGIRGDYGALVREGRHDPTGDQLSLLVRLLDQRLAHLD